MYNRCIQFQGSVSMKSILQQLYEGEIRPDLTVKPQSDEYLDAQIAFKQGGENLRAFMPELEPKLSGIIDQHLILCECERKEMFQYGFSLGVKLVVEALAQSDQ